MEETIFIAYNSTEKRFHIRTASRTYELSKIYAIEFYGKEMKQLNKEGIKIVKAKITLSK